METLEKVWVLYDEMFCDELSIKLLYQNKDLINEFVDIDKGVMVMDKYHLMKYINKAANQILDDANEVEGRL